MSAGLRVHHVADPAWRHVEALCRFVDIGTPGIRSRAGRRVITAGIVLILGGLLGRREARIMAGASSEKPKESEPREPRQMTHRASLAARFCNLSESQLGLSGLRHRYCLRRGAAE